MASASGNSRARPAGRSRRPRSTRPAWPGRGCPGDVPPRARPARSPDRSRWRDGDRVGQHHHQSPAERAGVARRHPVVGWPQLAALSVPRRTAGGGVAPPEAPARAGPRPLVPRGAAPRHPLRGTVTRRAALVGWGGVGGHERAHPDRVRLSPDGAHWWDGQRGDPFRVPSRSRHRPPHLRARFCLPTGGIVGMGPAGSRSPPAWTGCQERHRDQRSTGCRWRRRHAEPVGWRPLQRIAPHHPARGLDRPVHGRD